jgi:hypothetical protein
MARDITKISALVDRQLPEFISSEYPKFSAFLQKYYEQLELPGQPLDILMNLTKYHDIDFYEKKILQEFDYLTEIKEILNDNDEIIDYHISVKDADSFPDENGYILINDEAIFYKEKVENTFTGCFRNVSATTKLGDLYNESSFKTVAYADLNKPTMHLVGAEVYNISNLFLYAFVKSYESQYLASFPEESLKPEVDKRQLLKNIRSFYQSKGTEQSIEFVFNSIVTQDATDIPKIYYPKDNTIKASTSGWISKYALKVKVISGNVLKIIGQKITQKEDLFVSGLPSASAIVDNVRFLGNYNNELIYEIVLAPESVVGKFEVSKKTFLTKNLSPNDTIGNRINVFSTFGWNSPKGRILIGNESITFSDKNINQFYIDSRSGNGFYPEKTPVYDYKNLVSEYEEDGIKYNVNILPLGVLYNLNIDENTPFSSEGDVIQINDPGFDTRNPIIYDNQGNIRWKLNTLLTSPASTSLSDSIANISAIFEDENYYYITTSGFPDYFTDIEDLTPNDQKHLKLIRKNSENTTVVYKTANKDVGIFINGATAYSYKDYDENDIVFGGVKSIEVRSKGSGYKNPPYVLIEGDRGASARAMMSGEVVESIEIISEGKDYTTDPEVTITSGRGAKVEAIVTKDRITSLVITNPGEFYSSPPVITIIDSKNTGRLAEYTSVISSDGKLIGFNKIDEGRFYSQDGVRVIVEPVGRGATAKAFTKRWKKNRYEILKSKLDNNNGYLFENINRALGNGYSHVASPTALRNQLNDIGENHSPILGYAYDGNPIYGAFGYSDSLNSNSTIVRMSSSYRIDPNYFNRPDESAYPIGTLIEDYKYSHRFGNLDENNGRFCVTPEYPNGTYAYFITIDNESNPTFPYILGENYYSIPVDSNYNKVISQNDIPRKVKRLRTSNIPLNGFNTIATVETTNRGNIATCEVVSSSSNFSVGSPVFTNNKGTEGVDCLTEVDSIKGENVISIESQQTKALFIESLSPVYLFDESIVTQENTGAVSQVVGDVFGANRFVLRNVSENFNVFDKLNSSVRVINIIVDRPSFFTANSIVRLTNGKQVVVNRISNNNLLVSSNPFVVNEPISFPESKNGVLSDKIYYVVNINRTRFQIAETPNGNPVELENTSSFGVVANSEISRGVVLGNVSGANTLSVRVLEGEFIENTTDYLKSSNIDDTLGSRIFNIDELSRDITITSVNDNIAIVKTEAPHNLTENDSVTIDIDPDDDITTTNFYVRKRIYQKIRLETPQYNGSIKDTGIGSIKLLNSGDDYANTESNVYTDVELIFADETAQRNGLGLPGDEKNAKATITVNSGKVTNVTITAKGSEYLIGDILTVNNADLERSSSSLSQRVLFVEVSHVGLGNTQNTLLLTSVSGLSENDFLKINDEIVKITSVDSTNSLVTIERPLFSTRRQNHFNGASVVLYQPRYNFTEGYRIGPSTGDAFVKEYNPTTQELLVYFEITQTLNSINSISFFSTFRDSGIPSKIVRVNSVITPPTYNFEFSKDNADGPWIKNPLIEIQEFYKYKFITSHPSMSGSHLEFSPSGNYNILTTESEKGSIIPGSGDENTSFITVKFGYGDAVASNEYNNKKPSSFTKIFYFDKSGIIDNEESYLSIINDPLQGQKELIYVSSSSFVYALNNRPQHDGSGSISYITTSSFAVGAISSISIKNPGNNYKKLPSIHGVGVSKNNESVIRLNYNFSNKKVESIDVIIPGKNYVKPIVALFYKNRVVIPKYRIVKGNFGQIVAVINEDKDLRFDDAPDAFVIETDVTAFYSSNNIGTIKNIKIIENGSNYYDDYSILPYYTSHQVLIISNFGNDHFVNGEIIEQYENNQLIASAKISKDGYRNRVNVLKINDVKGEFKSNLEIIGRYKRNTCLVKKVFYSSISPLITSYYDNLGYYESDRGKTSEAYQRLTDSYFYQDYSYVVKSKSVINSWRKLVKQTAHPAGFNLFGEVSIESESEVKIPEEQPSIPSISIIELWDENVNRVTIESTTKQTTQNIVSFKDLNVRRGSGSVYASEYDTSETLSFIFILDQSFDGDFDESGNRSGRTTFNMVVPRVLPNGVVSNVPLNVANVNNLIITLDGILQEPEVAYKISGSQITFSQAPLGERLTQNQIVAPQNFVGRFVRFKSDDLNAQYFRKIQNIDSQFDSETTRFSLYYDNGDPVLLDNKENLLVSLDGVLQENKMTPLIPATSAYYINRNVVPNEIVFTKPPVSLNDSNYQHFFAYSVGNYERLSVDSNLLENNRGPFLIKSVLGNRVINIDNDRNILVFLDGILQIRNRAYTISGPFITFAESLKTNQKVNILYLYGRDIEKTLTFFNFENNNFFDIIDIVVDNLDSFDTTQQYIKNVEKYSTIYQGNNFIERSAIGEIVSFNVLSSLDYPGKTKINFRVKTQNQLFLSNKDLKFTDYSGQILYETISSDNIISVSPFEEDEDTRDILRKIKTGWLYGTSLDANIYNKIDKNDLIKVDGENEYRKVLNIPSDAKKIGHRPEDVLQTNHYSNVSVTSYDGMIGGVGLSVFANTKNGKVTSLSWNNRNYKLIETGYNNTATAYGYTETPELIFLPQPEVDSFGNIIGPISGGGASGYVVMNNGEIIDVVLTNSGSGYKTSPRVLVTRGFDIIKPEENITRNFSILNLIPKLFLDSSISRLITVIKHPSLLPEIQTISDLRCDYDSTNPTVIVTPPAKIVKISDDLHTRIISQLDLTAPEVTTISSVITSTDTLYEFKLTVESVSELSIQKTVSIDAGFCDTLALDDVTDRYHYDQLGNSFGTYENIKYADIGVAAITEQNTIEIMDNNYPNVTIGDFADRFNSYESISKDFWDATWPSIQEHGAILQISVDDNDDVLYATDTSRFPDSGQLLLGGSLYDGDVEVTPPSSSAEIVYYTSKLSDRFLGVSRGKNLTVAQPHDAGVYLRSLLDEYRFDFEVSIENEVINYPSYYYTRNNEYLQLVDNIFTPREGDSFPLL